MLLHLTTTVAGAGLVGEGEARKDFLLARPRLSLEFFLDLPLPPPPPPPEGTTTIDYRFFNKIKRFSTAACNASFRASVLRQRSSVTVQKTNGFGRRDFFNFVWLKMWGLRTNLSGTVVVVRTAVSAAPRSDGRRGRPRYGGRSPSPGWTCRTGRCSPGWRPHSWLGISRQTWHYF